MNLLFGLILLIWPMTTIAEWELISTTEAAQVFIDRETIEKVETIASVWELQNIGHYGSENQSSYRYLSQYDCENRRWMYSTFTKHSGPMATGDVIQRSDKTSVWRVVPPNTPASSVYRVVCGESHFILNNY